MASSPETKSASDRKITTMRLPSKLLDRLTVVAKAEGRSRTSMAETFIKEGVKKHERSRGVLG